MPELRGVVRSLKLVNGNAGPNQTFVLSLPDGRELRVELHAGNALREGLTAVVTGEFDTEGVLQAISAQQVVPTSNVTPKSSEFGFGVIIGSAILSDFCGLALIGIAYASVKHRSSTALSGLGDLILIVIACLFLCPILSLAFIRWFKGSLNSGRIWIAPFLSILLIIFSIYAVFRTR